MKLRQRLPATDICRLWVALTKLPLEIIKKHLLPGDTNARKMTVPECTVLQDDCTNDLSPFYGYPPKQGILVFGRLEATGVHGRVSVKNDDRWTDYVAVIKDFVLDSKPIARDFRNLN